MLLVRDRIVEGLRRTGLRAGGMMWLAGWALVLYEVDRPWRELGGLLSERMRWLERFVLGAAFVAGCVAGILVLDTTEDLPGRRAARLLRRAWLGPACCVALALVWLDIRGDWPRTLLVLAGWLGYWSGLDVSCGAWPLVRAERPRDRDGEA